MFASGVASPVKRWMLDYPSPKREVWLQPSGRVVQGWVLVADWALASDIHILAEWHAHFELCHTLAIDRPDVVEEILCTDTEGHPQLCCGFRFTLPADVGRFRLWVELKGQRWLLQQVDVAPVRNTGGLKVIQGEAGWLFLDNDTNLSVDQYTGHLQLTNAGIHGWRRYIEALLRSYPGLRRPPLLLVAPAKESVIGRYYPKVPAARSVLQPVLNLLPSDQVLYPVEELSVGLAEKAFFKTDSHWTQRGAGLVSQLLALRLGISAESVDGVLAKDQYVERLHTGDLGSKLEPKQRAPADFLRTFNYRSCIVYDNGLPNFGRLMVMQYSSALTDATCLIFGSSSSYSMLNYLCRFFNRLVFVHSAGNLDSRVIEAVAPDYLVAQTNARFMIRPPVADYSLERAMNEKQSSLDADGLERQSNIRNLGGLVLLKTLGLEAWHLPVPSMDE
jgi:hypothetical protein